MNKNYISNQKHSNSTANNKLKTKCDKRTKFNARSRLKSELPREFDGYEIERCEL
jgi:hypothetical protein